RQLRGDVVRADRDERNREGTRRARDRRARRAGLRVFRADRCAGQRTAARIEHGPLDSAGRALGEDGLSAERENDREDDQRDGGAETDRHELLLFKIQRPLSAADVNSVLSRPEDTAKKSDSWKRFFPSSDRRSDSGEATLSASRRDM